MRRAFDKSRLANSGFELSPVSVATIIVAGALTVYWVALFYGTHSRLPPGLLPGQTDKLIHLAAYAGLGALLITVRATRGTYPWTSLWRRWIVLAIYGAFDEITQMLVNRTADVRDWLADLIGAAIGLGLVTFALWCYRKPIPRTELAEAMSDRAAG